MSDDTPLLTREHVAKRLNIAPRTVADLVYRRKLSTIRVGRMMRFTPEHVEEYLARQEVKALPPKCSAPAIDPSRYELPPIRKRRLS